MNNSLMNLSIPAATTASKAPEGGYIPLGFSNTANIIWSKARQDVVELAASNLHSPGHLTAACGSTWILNTFGVDDHSEYGNGEKVLPKSAYKDLGNQISDACTRAGRYNTDKLKGAGVWVDASNDDVLVVNTESIFRTDRTEQDRITSDRMYLYCKDIGINSAQQPATVEEIAEIRAAFDSWSYMKPSDVDSMVGVLAQQYLTGALGWVTHVSITGPKGSGKTTKIGFCKTILDGAAILLSGDSTAAGIRQTLGRDALAVYLDEAEGSGAKVASHLALFREASSGSTVARGTQSQNALSFGLKVSGVVAGIVPPEMNPADLSRFLIINMRPVSDKQKRELPEIVKVTSEGRARAKELGKRFFARMLSKWSELKHCMDEVRNVLIQRADGRFCDTHGTVIAASWVAQNDGFITSEQAEKWVDYFDLAENILATKDSDDAVLALDHLLYTIMPVTNISVAEMCKSAVQTANNGQKDTLARYGIRVDLNYASEILLSIDFKNPELRKLFVGSNYEKGQIDKVLERLDGAVKKQVRINGLNKSAIVVNTHMKLKDDDMLKTIDDVIAETDNIVKIKTA